MKERLQRQLSKKVRKNINKTDKALHTNKIKERIERQIDQCATPTELFKQTNKKHKNK